MKAGAGLLLAVVALLASPSQATEIDAPLSDYLVTSWVDRDGVPIGTVYAIAQDRVGYLWLGTDGGLIRFDGFRFRTAETLFRGTLPRTAAVSLRSAADGSLWVGFANGDVEHIADDRIQPISTTGLGRGRVDVLVQDRSETIWAVAQGRVHWYHDAKWEAIPLGQPEAHVLNANIGRDGVLYVGTNRGLYRQTGPHEFQQVSEGVVWDVTDDSSGELWITHPTFGFMRLRNSEHSSIHLGNAYRMICDGQGYFWVATLGRGLWRVRVASGNAPDAIAVAPVPTLQGDSTQALFEDREGDIWIGTPTGLHRLARKPLVAIANAGPILSMEAMTDRSGIWAGAMFDGLLQFSRDGDTWRRAFHSGPGLSVRSLHRDASGTLWLGTNRGLGRVVDGRMVFVSPRSDAAAVSWLTSNKRGILWFGDGRHLYQFADGRISEVRLDSVMKPVTFANSDRQGRLWIAFDGGIIGRIDSNGQFSLLNRGDPITSDGVLYSMFDDSRGDVWFGASDGLYRYGKDRFWPVRVSTEWPGNQVWAIVEDDQHLLWLNTGLGVLRVHPDELARAAADPAYQIRYRLFDGNDGLGGATVSYLQATRGSDGMLWFARGGVLTAVDPLAVQSNDQGERNRVAIESVTTDRGPFDLSAGSALPASTSRLDVTFSMLHLSPRPRLRFRHRLEGFTSDWTDAGTRPVISYSNLSPGSYKLVIEAYSTDGTFGRASTWDFQLPPTLYQTRTFRALVVLALGAIIAMAWWRRTQNVHRQYAAVLAERARVSREIHDTLLQGVVGISLQLYRLQHSHSAEPEENAEQFERLRLQLEAYVRDARQSILDLRSPVLERRSLEEAFNEMGARLTEGTGIALSMRVRGKPRECPARMENELLRIGHEAIANAVRHAKAFRIDVELRFEDESVVLRVTDDGCGFNLEHASHHSTKHFGLRGMSERARSLGGDFRIATSSANGTGVEAILPIRTIAPAAAHRI
jgi:signal transduction histidine kinase/ligand-binding sensor domain-containing protein